MSQFTYEQVKDASDKAGTIKEFLINLGLVPNNGQYRRAKHIAAEHGVELPKFDPKTATKNAISSIKIPLDEFFVYGVSRQGQRLKKRLVEDYGWTNQCMIPNCPNPEPMWNGKPLTLQLDHIDGDNLNNIVENLRIICPNCHTQTETYSNKNR